MKKIKSRIGIDDTRLATHIQCMLRENAIHFEEVLRLNPDGNEWSVTSDFIGILVRSLDQLALNLTELAIERAQRRCSSKKVYSVISMDIVDAFDILRSTRRE